VTPVLFEQVFDGLLAFNGKSVLDCSLVFFVEILY